ncbi:MAG: cation:proton antiporter, partial [Actinobacteria bacterium]
IVLGPFVLNLINTELTQTTPAITTVALSFIAFNIGKEFTIPLLERHGTQYVILAVFESTLTWVLVTLSAWLIFGLSFIASLILGSIGAATAVAATFLVIEQFEAKGNLTDTILAVVALDDAYVIIAFALAASFAVPFQAGEGSVIAGIAFGLLEIVIAIGIGLVAGFITLFTMRWAVKSFNQLIVLLGAILVTAGVSLLLEASPLLSNIALGAVIASSKRQAEHLLYIVEEFAQPIYLLFFVLAGAALNFVILYAVGLLAIGYFIARIIGKYFGAYLGAIFSRSPKEVKNWLGVTLLPQAGLPIGLALVAIELFPDFGPVIANIIIGSTVIYELVGPLLIEFALGKVGEIKTNG